MLKLFNQHNIKLGTRNKQLMIKVISNDLEQTKQI